MTAIPLPSAQNPAPSAGPFEKRGHVLTPTASGGVFCCKCGRQTQCVKHVRLKITKSPCPNAALDPAKWLTTPGGMQASSRLTALMHHTQTVPNRDIHQLVWNQKSGKVAADSANFGLLQDLWTLLPMNASSPGI